MKKTKHIINWLELHLVSLLLIFLYVSEAYLKTQEFLFEEYTPVAKYFKLFIIVVISIAILRQKMHALVIPTFLIVLFIIGQLVINKNVSMEGLVAVTKYLYLILLLLFFSQYRLNENQKKQLFKTFDRLIFVNSFLVFIGFSFTLVFLKTYSGIRFGYNGLLITSTTSTYVYAIYLSYLFIRDKEALFKKVRNYIPLLAALLIGTKALYAFIVGLVFLSILRISNKKLRYGLLILSSLIALAGTYIFFFKYGLFNEIRVKDGLMSSIMSYRNELLVNKTIPFIAFKWEVINYFIGGLGPPDTKSQIDFIDIFYVFGIIGGLLYLYLFFKEFLKFSFSKDVVFLLSLFFIIVFLAGNFFSFASVAIYIVILREYLLLNDQNTHS